MKRKKMTDFITLVAMDLGMTPLGKKCGKYFNLMFTSDNCVVVESFEPNNTYGFTNINDLSDNDLEKIYNDLYEDFGN